MKTITAQHSDDRKILQRVTPLAVRLAEDTDWVQPSYYGGSKEQGFGVTILYEGTDYEILVETVCWMLGRGVTPHDHKTRGVVVGLACMETNIN